MINNITKFNESIAKIDFFEAFSKSIDLKDLDIVKINFKNEGINNYSTRIKSNRLKVKLIENHYEICVELKKSITTICDKCGSENLTLKDKVPQYYQMDKMLGLPTWMVYNRKQYRCGHCGHNVYLKCEDLGKSKYTSNLLLGIMDKLGQVKSRASISREYDVSKTLVTDVADSLPEETIKLGPILCIDEFKGNLDSPDAKWKDKYQTILVDGRNRRIIDILPTRQYADLVEYFIKIPLEEREKVEYCISDMSPIFIGVFKKVFPKAVIIIDRFHYTRLIVEAFEDIRKSLQDNTRYKHLGIKKLHKLFLKHADEIEGEECAEAREKLAKVFEKFPQLRQAYDILQEFYKFNQSSDRNVARIKFAQLKQKIEKLEGYEQIKKAMRSIENKLKYILNSFLISETNSYAEGYNNFIKVLKRVSYGCKNLLRFKKRVMYIQSCTKEYHDKKIKNKDLVAKQNKEQLQKVA